MKRLLFIILLGIIFGASLGSYAQEELYGVWQNVDKNKLKQDGLIFITPEYSAYLKETKQGYTFTKSKYEIAEDKKAILLAPMFPARIERKRNGDIILNATTWIIPHIFSYNGVFKREKMPKEKLYAYLDSMKLNIEEMKKSPIKDAPRRITKELVAKTKEEGKDLINLLKSAADTQDYSLPKEIEEYLATKALNP